MVKDDNNQVVVFISHKVKTAGDVAKLLIEKLEERGIKGFYCSRDCENDVSGDFVLPVVDAIEKCKLFLFLLDRESNVSDHCFNEIKLACDRAYNKKDLIMVVYRLDDTLYSKTVNYYLSRRHCIDGSKPPLEIRMEELADKICYFLEKGPSSFINEIDGAEVDYQLEGDAVYPDTSFVGREKELSKMHSLLHSGSNKLAVVGMGGIGKSEMVKKYVSLYRNEYSLVCFVPFGKSVEATLCDDNAIRVKGLSRKEHAEESDEEYAKRKLSVLKSCGSRLLLIIDNFDVRGDKDFEALLSGEYSLIFTSRFHHIHNRINEIEVAPMEENDLLALFQSQYTRLLDEDGLEDVRKMIDLLGGHTLFIRLIASSMQHKRIAPSKMLSALRKEEVDERTSSIAEGSLSSLDGLFNLSTLEENELVLLENLSLIPLSGIEVETFYDWTDLFSVDDGYELIDSLVGRSWVISDQITDMVHLHPLISELFHKRLEGNDEHIGTMLESVSKCVNDQLSYTYQKKLALANLTGYICENLPVSSKYYYEMRFTHGLAGSDAMISSIARKEFTYAYENAKTFRDKMRACHYLSQKEYLDGNPERGYEIALEGFKEFENMDPTSWPKDAGPYCDNVLQRAGEAARAMGRYEEALDWFLKAKGPCELYPLKSVHHSMGWVNYQIADVYLKMGDLEKSEAYAKESLNHFEMGRDYWSKACILGIFKDIYVRSNKIKDAIKVNQERIVLFLKYDGELSGAPIYEESGDLYLKEGLEKEALENYEVSKRLFELRKDPSSIARLETKISNLKS